MSARRRPAARSVEAQHEPGQVEVVVAGHLGGQGSVRSIGPSRSMSANSLVERGRPRRRSARAAAGSRAGRRPSGSSGSCGRSRAISSTAASTSSVTRYRRRSSASMSPWAPTSSRTKRGQRLPVGAAGHVEQHDRRRRRPCPSARSVSSSKVSSRVPKPPGRDDEAVRLLHQHQLAGEEVLHLDELGVAGDERVGALLERQPDVHAEAVLAAGALEAGGHDPGPGAGDDHPALARPGARPASRAWA